MTSLIEPERLVNILLIDDHPLVRDGLRARLEAVPHFRIVAEASDAQEALHHAKTREIELALMDINLGDSSGIDLTAQFNAFFPHIAILVLSMHDKVEYAMQSIQAGARGYVLKDAPGRDIVLAIETVIAGGIYYSPVLAKKLAQPMEPGLLLTLRERQVLQHIAAGKANKQIAQILDISVRTVETHRLNIKRKVNIDGQAELIKFAVQKMDLS